MEWFAGFFASIIAFVSSLVPSFGAEVSYRLSRPAAIIDTEVTVLFGGDMMFDRSVRVAMQEQGDDFIFSCFGELLKKADITVANLEGPITNNPSKSVGSKVGEINNTKFTFAPTVATTLARQGIDIVSLANNHAQDFGYDGVRSTMQYLEGAGVGYFGDPFSERDYRVRKKGVSLAFIGYNEFQEFASGLWLSSSTTVEKIQSARADGYMPIVFAHWGLEYEPETYRMKQRAHEWIDAGAEMVIGAHPHVVQGHEEYMGKHIYYSLGNMIFDQYFSEDVRSGLLVEVIFGPHGASGVTEVPIRLERDRRTCPVS